MSIEVKTKSELASNNGDRTRYFPSAQLTFDALFDTEGEFIDPDHLVEVPADQYEICLNMVRDAIAAGHISGESNVDRAHEIIRKGEFSYDQVRRIAQSRKIASLEWHEEDQSISCDFEYAITFSIQFARGKWEGLTDAESIGDAAAAGDEDSFVAGWIDLHPAIRHMTSAAAMAGRVNLNRLASSQLGRSVVQRVTAMGFGQASATGAMGQLTKLMRVNAISAVILAITVCVPDVVKAWYLRSISWRQCGKNSAKNAIGVFTGVAGWVGGLEFGGWLAEAMNAAPGFWTHLPTYGCALLAGILICLVATEGSRRFFDRHWEEDATLMTNLVNDEIAKLASKHLLTPSEGGALTQAIRGTLKAKWLRQMWRAGARTCSEEKAEELRREFVHKELVLEAAANRIVDRRTHVSMPDPSMVEHELEAALAQIAEA